MHVGADRLVILMSGRLSRGCWHWTDESVCLIYSIQASEISSATAVSVNWADPLRPWTLDPVH